MFKINICCHCYCCCLFIIKACCPLPIHGHTSSSWSTMHSCVHPAALCGSDLSLSAHSLPAPEPLGHSWGHRWSVAQGFLSAASWQAGWWGGGPCAAGTGRLPHRDLKTWGGWESQWLHFSEAKPTLHNTDSSWVLSSWLLLNDSINCDNPTCCSPHMWFYRNMTPWHTQFCKFNCVQTHSTCIMVTAYGHSCCLGKTILPL